MKNRSEKKRLDGNSFLLAVTIILFFVMYIAGIIMFGGRGFAKVQNFLNLFISNAGLIVVATGMTIVMITGGIDISVGSVVAMVCMMLAWMMERGNIGAFPAILIVLATGCIFGLVQGFLVAYLKIQPFIVTLAGMFFARGMTSIISQEMISITNKTFTGIATFKMYLPFGGYLNKKGVMIYPYVYPSV
ncbi:ABC transporter permease subunit, partial [Enterocloster bolteae]